MALETGTQLGSYEILSPLGAGGMGEVYRARDTKLGRDVALKVLPEAFINDSQRMARFQREAQVLASLNHPNIAAIYGLEESNGVRALVMELVEGPTLADRLKAGGIPSDEVLPISKQVAEGLEYAHERGVVHRDLKPANIKIAPEGTVKILDFGLAKALDPAVTSSNAGAIHESPLQNSPTLTAAATRAGVILGTAAYMPPEQARGKTADRRADIWAFGCVLYEMLSGRPPFEGETVTDVLASVVRAEPDWDALPAQTSPRLRELIRRCLAKDPKQRLRDIGEARITIEEVISGVGGIRESPLPVGEPSSPLQPRLRRALPWAVLAVLTLLFGLAAGWWARARRTPPSMSWSAQLLGGPRTAMGARISPDGRTLAFQAMVDGLTQVAVMDTDSGDWTVLTRNRARGFVTELNWSSDGSAIYFDRMFSVPQGIYTVSRFGGDERLVLKDAMGTEVLPDGSLLVVRLNQDRVSQLHRFWPESGRLEPLDVLLASQDLAPAVRAFRDGREAVYFGRTLSQDKADSSSYLHVINLESGKSRRLEPQLGLRPPSELPVFPLTVSNDDQSVLVDQLAGNLHRVISISRDGQGPVRPLFTLTLPPLSMDMAANGDLYVDQLARPAEVMRFTASGGTPEPLTSLESPSNNTMVPLPDGRVVLASMVAGRPRLLAVRPGGEATPFIQTKEETDLPGCSLGEGEFAFLLGPTGRTTVAVASIADGRIVRRLDQISTGEITSLAASPDGKTIYYVASGTVWAVSSPGGQPRRITSGDAVAADPDGKELIVQIVQKEGIRLMRVPVSGGAEQPIPIQSALRLTSVGLSPNAVGNDGRVLVSVAAADSWFYRAAILNPQSGMLDRIPLNFDGDVLAPGWAGDGRIVSSGLPTKATLWRFHPAASDQN